jgi:hypothetical protein
MILILVLKKVSNLINTLDLPEIKKKKFKDSLGGVETSKSGRKKKVYWTDEEIKNLEKGVKIYGEGNWSLILRRLKFDPCNYYYF